MTHALPRFIALCGNPKAGKSLVQTILKEEYGVQPVDDGGALRKIGMDFLKLTHNQVYTQDGKKEFVEILGRTWQVREILGELGNKFEEMFGGDIMPLMTMNTLPPGHASYSFGSVRRDQGKFYQSLGGVVIGVRNPQTPPSQYEFDRFNESLVDLWIENDGLLRFANPLDALKNLRLKVHAAVAQIVTRKAA